MKSKEEIKKLATEQYYGYLGGYNDRQNFIHGYKMAQNDMKKYKKAFDILNCYFDSISDEEKPKVSKQLTKLGLI